VNGIYKEVIFHASKKEEESSKEESCKEKEKEVIGKLFGALPVDQLVKPRLLTGFL